MSQATAQTFTAEERRNYIGASEIGAILGLDRYKTALDVYNQKLGLTAPFEGNRHTERGNRLERVAADIFAETTGKRLRRRNSAFVHPNYPFIVGHVDRTVEGERTIAEIKCPSLAAFRKMQREGLPETYLIQMQVYLGLSGYSEGVYIIFCADQMDCASFDISFDAAIYETAVMSAVNFWNNHVRAGVPPSETNSDKEKIEVSKIGGSTVFRDDDTFAEAAQLLREANQLKKDGEELYELAKSKVLSAIEEVEGVYEGAGLRLFYQAQNGRKTFDKKALAAAHPEIDLSKFEKQGAPFFTFRPIFLNS